jgi:hypothetical protein
MIGHLRQDYSKSTTMAYALIYLSVGEAIWLLAEWIRNWFGELHAAAARTSPGLAIGGLLLATFVAIAFWPAFWGYVLFTRED